MTDVAPAGSGPHLVTRPYQGTADFWRVRDLLIETYPLTPPGFNWEIRRWDGWLCHREDPEAGHVAGLWETADGRLAGAVHAEGEGDACLEIHPDYRHLIEEEMVAWAEAHLAQRRLEIYVHEYDAPRRRLLERRGYEKTSDGGTFRRLRIGRAAPLDWAGVSRLRGLPQPAVTLAQGYVLRTTRPGDEDDYRRMAAVLNAGFGRTFHTDVEYATFATKSPSFRHDLNLVAEAPDGSFASHVGVTYVEANRYGVFEPVCTHPDHRRKGLARDLMCEGLRRLEALGATDVFVGTGDAVAANELYESIGFTEAYRGYTWRKVW